MAKLQRLAIALSSTALALSFHSPPAQAQRRCILPDAPAPATTTRTATFPKLDLKVIIPGNYRTMLFNDGSIHVMDPWTFKSIECRAKGIETLGTEYNTQEFRLVDNPHGLSPADFAETPIASEVTASSGHSVNGIDVFIQRPDSPVPYHYVFAWLQLPESEQILRVSLEGSPEDLLELLNRCTFL